MLPSRVDSWPYPPIFDQSQKACQGQTLSLSLLASLSAILKKSLLKLTPVPPLRRFVVDGRRRRLSGEKRRREQGREGSEVLGRLHLRRNLLVGDARLNHRQVVLLRLLDLKNAFLTILIIVGQ